MRAVLDTSVLLGPAPRPIEGDVAISSTWLAELHFGVLVGRTAAVRAQRLRRLGAVERGVEALPVDARVARVYESWLPRSWQRGGSRGHVLWTC